MMGYPHQYTLSTLMPVLKKQVDLSSVAVMSMDGIYAENADVYETTACLWPRCYILQ